MKPSKDNDIRITVTNEYRELNDDIKDIYPVITIITPEESEDDVGYPIFVATDLEERKEGYFEWSHRDITNFIEEADDGEDVEQGYDLPYGD